MTGAAFWDCIFGIVLSSSSPFSMTHIISYRLFFGRKWPLSWKFWIFSCRHTISQNIKQSVLLSDLVDARSSFWYRKDPKMQGLYLRRSVALCKTSQCCCLVDSLTNDISTFGERSWVYGLFWCIDPTLSWKISQTWILGVSKAIQPETSWHDGQRKEERHQKLMVFPHSHDFLYLFVTSISFRDIKSISGVYFATRPTSLSLSSRSRWEPSPQPRPRTFQAQDPDRNSWRWQIEQKQHSYKKINKALHLILMAVLFFGCFVSFFVSYFFVFDAVQHIGWSFPKKLCEYCCCGKVDCNVHQTLTYLARGCVEFHIGMMTSQFSSRLVKRLWTATSTQPKTFEMEKSWTISRNLAGLWFFKIFPFETLAQAYLNCVGLTHVTITTQPLWLFHTDLFKLVPLKRIAWFDLWITPASDPKQCVGGQQQKILYVSLRQPPNTRRRDKSQENCLQDICLCLLYTSYLKILCRSHVSDLCRSVHQWGAATRSTSSDSCLNIFVSQAPLQDPCLWIHVSASMCISGSSARSMLPDS